MTKYWAFNDLFEEFTMFCEFRFRTGLRFGRAAEKILRTLLFFAKNPKNNGAEMETVHSRKISPKSDNSS
jgi:hypothetical protein